jgi:hypothetical protein
MATVLDTGPKSRGFKAMVLRAIKIRSTPSFGREVKPKVRCRKILRHAKEPGVVRV